MKIIVSISAVLALAAAVLLYIFVFNKNLNDQIVIPYIAHQKPRIDPHLPSSIPIADKLDEVYFDGLFNVSANPSGIVYEDGLGEFMGIDANNVVSVRLKGKSLWHSSYEAALEKKKIHVNQKQEVLFAARDLKFTLRRIQKLGSLSPDYILVSQAVPDFDFTGPDENDEIKFQFRGDRIWTEGDIKEILSFKVLSYDSDVNAPEYKNGTGPYLHVGEQEDAIFSHKLPSGNAVIPKVVLKPFIDNSTYTTELKNKNINTILSSPFGSISPILRDTLGYFHKSNISTTFFAVFFNVNRLNLEKRMALRKLIDNQVILNRFFKTGTPQQRHIANYKGDNDNYDEYLNYSVFPTSSYYVEEQIITPVKEKSGGDPSVLTDTIHIKTCVNYDYREELIELVDMLNDPGMFHGKLKVSAVSNEEIRKGDYDAVLVPITGYRSNFLFDLYSIFLREPDMATHKINLQTVVNAKGEVTADLSCFQADKNFFRIDLGSENQENADYAKLLEYVYGFMSTREVGDKQAYAQLVDQLEQQLCLGAWLFSLPSLAYFSKQFDNSSIDLYGTASQLSTIEKWKQAKKRK